MKKSRLRNIQQITKGNSGITLIALVITIIILLILAGISIAMIAGQNGILNQATSAKNETIKGEKAITILTIAGSVL